MALGRLQTRVLMGIEGLEPQQTRDRAKEASERFVRAYRRLPVADAPGP